MCSSIFKTPPVDFVGEAIASNERIATFGRHRVQMIHNGLLKAGFTPENSIEVIKGHPEVLRFTPQQLEKSLEAWHICNFTQTQFYDLFVQCPELLEFDDQFYIASRFAELKKFAATPKNIWRLLMASPNVLVDDEKVIRAKVSYVLNEMEADETDLLKSGALGLPLSKIKTRHMLMVRLGIYRKRKWKASEMDPNKNPRISRIMDSNDTQFATKVCGISTKEFEAFCELYEREMKELKEEAEDYNDLSEDDTDTDDSDGEEFDARQNQDFYDDRSRRRYTKNKSKLKKTYKRKPL